MTSIKTINEIIREKMNECADIGASQFMSSIRPIYGSSRNGVPLHIGTGILLEVSGEKYLLTAAHIIDENDTTSLYVGMNSELLLLEGNIQITQKMESERKNDHFDFAWVNISKSLLVNSSAKDVTFISENDISREISYYTGRQYLALGYPYSKNKKIFANTKQIRPKYLKYSSIVKQDQDLCKKLNINGSRHLFLDFNSKLSKDSEGSLVNSISPKGLSGGALVDMGRISTPENLKLGSKQKGKLAGLIIENHTEFNIISATKINTIIDQIIRNDE